ncbi:MAG: DUF4920 domain-containing protein [Myxococcales bacterium]|nr:DUF4920 domain-containing protein [Myxococcales bacterium]
MRTLLLLTLALGCASQSPPPTTPEAPSAAAPATAPAGPEAFGEPLSDAPVIALATLAADPASFAGQTVKTEGEVTQVCQRMGCWMEMRAEDAPTVRVPMAGHAFFLPRDAAGRRATVEGQLVLRELSDDEREHLESEGAEAAATALQLTATGVVLH